ncbi:twin-arginine translocation signal domain-containing protein [Frigoribacterium sp. PhB107]
MHGPGGAGRDFLNGAAGAGAGAGAGALSPDP